MATTQTGPANPHFDPIEAIDEIYEQGLDGFDMDLEGDREVLERAQRRSNTRRINRAYKTQAAARKTPYQQAEASKMKELQRLIKCHDRYNKKHGVDPSHSPSLDWNHWATPQSYSLLHHAVEPDPIEPWIDPATGIALPAPNWGPDDLKPPDGINTFSSNIERLHEEIIRAIRPFVPRNSSSHSSSHHYQGTQRGRGW